ncbi:MAG: lipopolysaccharide heptosyltransferase II [Thermomicrobium sp.]|nr:lipopolysaccharide heptosyltransferase II [Thermomicrobium sp.]
MQRILVVKPCCLGDALMATPVLRALHAAYPTATIDVAVTPWAAPAFHGHPAIRRLVRYPERPNLPRLLALARRLARERYDAALGLDRSPYVGLLLWASRIPVRAGLGTGWRGLLYSHRISPTAGKHESELYLAVSRALGVPDQGLEPEYFVASDDRARMLARVAGFARPLVVLHPGGAVNPGSRLLAKRWPPERFAQLAERLVTAVGATILLVGGPTDTDAARAVRAQARCELVDWCARLTWQELAALLAVADLFVGNDTGAGHLAAAVGTPTVSIFGPTSPLRYRPLGRRSVVCAPPASWTTTDDRDLRRPFTVSTERDIGQVTVEEVFHACRTLLDSRGNER